VAPRPAQLGTLGVVAPMDYSARLPRPGAPRLRSPLQVDSSAVPKSRLSALLVENRRGRRGRNQCETEYRQQGPENKVLHLNSFIEPASAPLTTSASAARR